MKLKELVKLLEELNEITHDKDLLQTDDDMNIWYNQDLVEQMTKIIKKINDPTKIGDLYLTSGDRIVLNKGYGEYFNKTDTKLFTLEELTIGMSFKKFKSRLELSVDGGNTDDE